MIAALCSASHPWWVWAGFVLLVFILLAIDLGVFHRKTHSVTIREALTWALVWFGLAMVFNIVVWWQCGTETALQFFTGYIIEESLSIDNLFVILLIFTAFRIPSKLQHRVLFWGILGAMIMRGILIGLGAAIVSRFDWVFYVFGAFLVYTGFRMLFQQEENFDPHESFVVRYLGKIVPISKRLDGEKFFTMERGKRAATLLFVTLIVIEFTDLVFAFDSIPAIFAITTNPFIVFTSNIFAILGLRSLYFVIAEAHGLFKHLKTGLAIILAFIGIKLLLKDIVHINIFVSLGIVIAVLATSIAYSIFDARSEKKISKRRK
jgi:tellurite resistance protein TerC